MAGIPVEKLSHSCGTRKGLQVFADPDTGKVDGYCFSCCEYVPDPYGKPVTADEIELPEEKTEEEIKLELANVFALPTVDLPTRKLRAKYLEEFGMKTALSEQDGKTPTILFTPVEKGGKVTGFYAKPLDKKISPWAIGNVKKAEPIGWSQAKSSGAYRLYITEGPEDAVAVTSMFDRFGKQEYKPAVVSLPNGVNSVNSSLSIVAEEARRLFKEIVLVFDNDDPGQAAVERAMLIFPKAKIVTLPEKDANDCLIKGAQKAAYNALSYSLEAPKNTSIVWANEELHERARTPTPRGELTWPYPTLDAALRGIRYGETVYIGAGVKMGKSELLNDLAAHFIKAHGVSVFMAKPEEENDLTYKLIANKMVGERFHDPDVPFNYEKFDEAGKMLKGKIGMLDLYQHMGWESLKKDIIVAANNGVKVIFIDPITNLTSGMQAGDANTELEKVSRDASALAKDLNVVIFMFCHLKAPEGNIQQSAREKYYRNGQYVGLGNCPHEKGGTILSNQFRGSRAMMQACDLMLGLEGNKDEELPEEVRNSRWLRILEDRRFGTTKSARLFWNEKTTQFKEINVNDH